MTVVFLCLKDSNKIICFKFLRYLITLFKFFESNNQVILIFRSAVWCGEGEEKLILLVENLLKNYY